MFVDLTAFQDGSRSPKISQPRIGAGTDEHLVKPYPVIPLKLTQRLDVTRQEGTAT
jgi:hypothetical protein